MLELFRLLGIIAIKNDEANEAIDETTDKASKSEGKIGKAFEKVGSAAVKVGKTMAAGLAVCGTAITAVAKQALDGYADYEQLVGGVETLFKDSAGKLMEYANQAYETAGMSANKYMETVTSFSASLLQSLDGDTAAAAEKANQAIIDMSDNANKMGTSMESIQNAYQGFAKQNYTMLDNLKLGYGGTKAEMQRLLNDAKAISGIEYDLDSYADVVDAIHVIQEEMGIAGTTAKEASSTISGSLNATKAAWKNLLTGMANGEADLSTLMDAVADSVATAAENIVPVIKKAISSMSGLAEYLLPLLIETISDVIEDIAPSLIRGAVQLMKGLISALPTILQILIEQLPYIITEIGKALIDVFPLLLQTTKDLIGQLIDFIGLELFGISDSSEIVFGTLGQKFEEFCGILKMIWESVGKPVWDMISYAISGVQDMFADNMPKIMKFCQDAFSGIQDTWENHLKPMFEAVSGYLNNTLKPAFEFVFDVIIRPLIENVFGFIKNLWHDTLKPVFDGICDFLTGTFSGDWEKAFQGILNIVKGILNGVANVFISCINTAKDVVAKGIDKIKGFFNFDWKLPKLKLPHFKISGSFSLNPPSVPSFGIDWYAKAMDDPMIMDTPTAFGINAKGQIMAGGEAGSEVVSGTETLMNMIASAVAAQNEALVNVLLDILDAILALQDIDISAILKIVPDDRGIFKIVERQARIRKNATGKAVFE